MKINDSEIVQFLLYPIQVTFRWICWSNTSLALLYIFLSWLFVCKCDSNATNATNISNSTSGVEGFMEFLSSGRRRKSRKVCFPRIATFFMSHVLYCLLNPSLAAITTAYPTTSL